MLTLRHVGELRVTVFDSVMCPMTVYFRVRLGQSAASTRCRSEAEPTVCDRRQICPIIIAHALRGVPTLNSAANRIVREAGPVCGDSSSTATRDAL
ncbi:hypothetical protein F2P79_019134 [Pimephales promelas]|nr:hypothetical protein F2P79_019134 [Pimephales promelas]